MRRGFRCHEKLATSPDFVIELLCYLYKPETEEDPRCVHDTLVGAFIEYSKDGVLLELYENIEGKGVRTDVIELVYTQDAIVLFQP